MITVDRSLIPIIIVVVVVRMPLPTLGDRLRRQRDHGRYLVHHAAPRRSPSTAASLLRLVARYSPPPELQFGCQVSQEIT